MLSITISTVFVPFANGLSKGRHTLVRYIGIMASALASLLHQSRISQSESPAKPTVISTKYENMVNMGDPRIYPGSLHRHQQSSSSVGQYRSMLDVDTPSLNAIALPQEESMEDWVAEKLSQTERKHRTENWADILCYYTATNGTAPAAPTRTSPAPVPNGKPSSPLEVPQSVSSSDPKIAAQQASDMRNIVRRKLTGYVGFANLPNQWHRKSVRKGFNFNVMVVGTFVFALGWHVTYVFQANLGLESPRW